MTTAILRVFPNRQLTDVVTTAVLRVPGCSEENENLSPVLSCEFCGDVPTYDPNPNDPAVPVALQLVMVQSPDRIAPIFLGPKCLDKERARYISRAPVMQ